MTAASRAAIGDGVPEYKVALATSQLDTRKAAELLSAHCDDADMSPNTHFLQIMASGRDIVKTHLPASTRIMRCGEPVFLCFCGRTNFGRVKLGFHRTIWIGEASDDQAAVYAQAGARQKAALDALGPGVTDDNTILQPGMVLAVNGSVSVETFRAQVGDSFIITKDEWEPLTHYPKALAEVILQTLPIMVSKPNSGIVHLLLQPVEEPCGQSRRDKLKTYECHHIPRRDAGKCLCPPRAMVTAGLANEVNEVTSAPP